jgi:hypothetical protein
VSRCRRAPIAAPQIRPPMPPELAVYSEGDRAARRDEPEPAGQIVIVAAFRSSTASMGFGYMSRRCSLCFLRRRTARCRLDDACLRGSAAYSAHASQPACFASPTSASVTTNTSTNGPQSSPPASNAPLTCDLHHLDRAEQAIGHSRRRPGGSHRHGPRRRSVPRGGAAPLA